MQSKRNSHHQQHHQKKTPSTLLWYLPFHFRKKTNKQRKSLFLTKKETFHRYIIVDGPRQTQIFLHTHTHHTHTHTHIQRNKTHNNNNNNIIINNHNTTIHKQKKVGKSKTCSALGLVLFSLIHSSLLLFGKLDFSLFFPFTITTTTT
eukprot:UN01329